MNEQKSMLRQIKPKPIPAMLIICFAILLYLIWVTGSKGQNRLEEIRARADESARSYNTRLRLAMAIRVAATRTINKARVYRDSQSAKIPVPVYKLELNKEKALLEKLLVEGKKLWGRNEPSLSAAEVGAWQKIESATNEFWRLIDEGETEQPSDPPKDQNAGGQISGDSKIDSQNASPPTGLSNDFGEEFFQRRTKLEAAADELSNIISSELDQSQDGIIRLKDEAVTEVKGFKIITISLGIIVSAITGLLIRRYLNQIKQEERLKQEAQGQLRSVFDSLTNDIVVIGQQGEVIDVNRAFLKHFEVSDAELKLQDYQAALAQLPEVASFVEETFQKQEFDQRRRGRIEIKPNNGHPSASLFDVSVSPLKVGNATEGRVVVMDDVTEDERVREELRRSRTLSAVGQITAQVAHEIYNPLGAVKLNLELLEMQIIEDDDVRHTIGRLNRGVEHLSTIIMDLRYLTRPREPERKPTDLNKLLDEVVELASDRVERSRVCIARDYSSEIRRGEFDPQQLRKVFLNLLINAVEASAYNGEVALQTQILSKEEADAIQDFKSTDGAIAVSVIDHGVGMSPETKRRLFEAFYTTKRNGTGLGMMITQEIVKKHGGKIDVESEEGKGTKVTVYLPA